MQYGRFMRLPWCKNADSHNALLAPKTTQLTSTLKGAGGGNADYATKVLKVLHSVATASNLTKVPSSMAIFILLLLSGRISRAGNRIRQRVA